MQTLTFPSTPEEFEEYTAFMNNQSDEAEMQRQEWAEENGNDYAGNAPDDSYLDDDAAYWASLQREDGDEDRYLDASWEDQCEYGMEGCCGDF